MGNPQLAAAVTLAKKAGVPKATIEGAIARGQGRSISGAALESLTFETMMPPSVALIVDVETDSRLRILQELNHLAKKLEGTAAPTKFLFSRLGRVVFEKSASAGLDEIMDDAIEAGAEDLETDDEGNLVAWTQPSLTKQLANHVGAKFQLKVLSADIIWSPNEDTRAELGSTYQVQKLTELLAAFRDFPDVQAVYSNAIQGDVDQETWEKVEQYIDV